MRFAGAMLAGALLLGGPASAQIDSRDGIALQNQILELRQQVQILQQQRGGPAPSYRPDRSGGGDTSGLTAQLLDRVSTLEDQVRSLRGQLDQVTNAQQRQSEDLAKQIGDLKFAMQNSSPPTPSTRAPRGGDAPVLSPPASVLGDSGGGSVLAGPAPRTPELAMQEANAALARRDYPAAEAAAREIINKRGPRAGDAQFILAQAEMGERNYQQAAPDFYDAYNRNRTGARAPDALLGVASALVALGDKPSACDALAKLRSEFPSPRPDIRDGEVAVRGRAGCR